MLGNSNSDVEKTNERGADGHFRSRLFKQLSSELAGYLKTCNDSGSRSWSVVLDAFGTKSLRLHPVYFFSNQRRRLYSRSSVIHHLEQWVVSGKSRKSSN